MRPSAIVAIAVDIGVLGVSGTAIAGLAVLAGTPALERLGGPVFVMLACTTSVLFALVGSVIVVRVPGNRIAWLMLGTGVAFAVAALGGLTVAWELDHPGTIPGASILEWSSGTAWYLMVGLLWPQLLLLFPDGRLPSPRWRIVAAIQAAGWED